MFFSEYVQKGASIFHQQGSQPFPKLILLKIGSSLTAINSRRSNIQITDDNNPPLLLLKQLPSFLQYLVEGGFKFSPFCIFGISPGPIYVEKNKMCVISDDATSLTINLQKIIRLEFPEAFCIRKSIAISRLSSTGTF
uniref:Uncharacterized protein n=1 Tax=Opuntia streptacantha TaxID=393608 RepID=A0A7C9EHN6_OPUST